MDLYFLESFMQRMQTRISVWLKKSHNVHHNFILVPLTIVQNPSKLVFIHFLGKVLAYSLWSIFPCVVLKMARLTKDSPARGQRAISDSVSKAPSCNLIIPVKELVQVIAKVGFDL